MAASILEAIAKLNSQNKRIQNDLQRARNRKESAWTEYKKTESEYLRAENAWDINTERIEARSEELKHLLGSEASLDAAEVDNLTADLVLEPLLSPSKEAGSQEKTMPGSALPTIRYDWAGKEVVAKRRRVASQRTKARPERYTGRALRNVDPDGVMQSVEDVRLQPINYDSDNVRDDEALDFGVRDRRSLSVWSNIIVGKPNTPAPGIVSFGEDITLEWEQGSQRDSLCSVSSDGLFVSEDKHGRDASPLVCPDANGRRSPLPRKQDASQDDTTRQCFETAGDERGRPSTPQSIQDLFCAEGVDGSYSRSPSQSSNGLFVSPTSPGRSSSKGTRERSFEGDSRLSRHRSHHGNIDLSSKSESSCSGPKPFDLREEILRHTIGKR